MKLSCISLAMLPLLSVFSVQAAVYNVVEVGQVDELKLTYAAGINNTGDTVFNGGILTTSSSGQADMQLFNFPIDLSLIDFENEIVQSWFTEAQLNDLLNGIVTADTLAILLSRNPSGQQIGAATSFIKADNLVAQNQLLRDTNASRSNNEYLFSINDQGIAVGFATNTYVYESFTSEPTEAKPEPETENLWVPQLPRTVAVVVRNGEVISLQPEYNDVGGGFSEALNINNINAIAGYGSISIDDDIAASIATNCVGKVKPVDQCIYEATPKSAYEQRAMVWQLQPDGSVNQPAVYGYLGDKNTGLPYNNETPTDTINTIKYSSQANAVNTSGIAVGVSTYSDSSRTIRYGTVDAIYRQDHATIFSPDGALPIVDPSEWFFNSTSVLGSSAVDINDQGTVVGYANKVINGSLRSRMFVYDYNTAQLSFPAGFFTSSSTIPQAINNNGLVVGSADVIISGTVTRRKHGYVYDVASSSMTDLNTLVGCNSPYTIVNAADINDNGVITATAVTQRESKDLLGAAVLDAQGNPVMEEVATVVLLQPIANGEVENCNTDETQYSRQGGSLSFIWLLFGGALLWRRR
ncbi:DUF3466 family protein [Rheinheimera sp.]|uniref:DUF3466 family protein n=1 Tax=Rheinheimera sp. TaxID=1869214 RepID=UPI004048C3E3